MGWGRVIAGPKTGDLPEYACMNVSASSGASAAWMLQQLFQSSGEDASTNAASGAERQNVPGADGRKCNAGGSSAPQVASATMSIMITMQMQAPPSASNIASNLVDALDTNGDGKVSAEEIAAAFKTAGLATDKVNDAVKALDTDGDGQLSAGELAKAISSDVSVHHHHDHGGPPPAGDVANSVLAAFDTNADSGLSLSEIASGLGKQDGSAALSGIFSSLDSNGDGVLSADELTSAIKQDMTAGYRTYASAS
jgi:Ca2+-binding EF-hand superfamily protein